MIQGGAQADAIDADTTDAQIERAAHDASSGMEDPRYGWAARFPRRPPLLKMAVFGGGAVVMMILAGWAPREFGAISDLDSLALVLWRTLIECGRGFLIGAAALAGVTLVYWFLNDVGELIHDIRTRGWRPPR